MLGFALTWFGHAANLDGLIGHLTLQPLRG